MNDLMTTNDAQGSLLLGNRISDSKCPTPNYTNKFQKKNLIKKKLRHKLLPSPNCFLKLCDKKNRDNCIYTSHKLIQKQ